ncbi:hypothetical protein N7481_001458 [Penicillium waksmanii]|uniref:uncharacterized protein n=1 Tax=Penicillium waksmanii TaxID=69791 RepID=UPI0025485445|nr:uncharacterized protein N7481_013353 [Penicillium waksmanii]XP_057118339.1 uncharacterized protein N7481_011946 [Penicillium waksmanii]XP_057128506.1 uncharacterized protein N7481_001455 [Penicillium waksmanii]XP_057128509.1 uncharacterized protein N7481_001458 [Penicillium waksmanii]KAJ5963048.1 hypothetical protein N7481_013353 [Penicillium waksmanii]KAJ5974736.1 hypothetical protein N7481_011946 [Penicillium waksmanii]KAJ6001046.1 hypothetical protein N7481_001455 [Penicillium waksmanii
MSTSEMNTLVPVTQTAVRTARMSMPIPEGLIINGTKVHTIDDMIKTLQGCQQKDKYDLALHCYGKLNEVHKVVGDGICKLFDYVSSEELWKGHHESHAEFQQQWEDAVKLQKRKEKDAMTIEGHRRRALTKWDNGNPAGRNTAEFFQWVINRAFSEKVSKLLNTDMSYDDVKLSINNYVIKRCTFGKGSGSLKSKHMEPSDLTNTYNCRILSPITQDQLDRAGLQLDQDGFVCPRGEGFDLPLIEPRATTLPPSPEKSGSRPETITAAEESEDQDMDHEEEEADSVHLIDAPKMTDVMDIDTDTESESENDHPDAEQSPQHAQTDPAAEESDDEILVSTNERAKCGCLLRPTTLVRALKDKDFSKRRNGLIALRMIGRRLARSEGITISTLCNQHAKALVDAVQMTSASKNHQQLVNRVALSYQHIGKWDQFMKDHPRWFSFRQENSLGFHRFRPQHHAPLISDFVSCTEWLSVETLIDRIYAGEAPDISPANDMHNDGSTVLPNLFSWLGEDLDGRHPEGLWPLIHQEFRMYHYHLSDATKELGWLRGMWHSNIQQLIRQDLSYYMAYVFFRPDHAWRLISHPYYIKSTQAGEHTEFRHLDINIQDYLDSQRGSSLLQGSVSFTQEDEQNCTVLLKGMHKTERLAKWWKDIQSRGPVGDGFISGIKPFMWRKEDEETYGTQWTTEVCGVGDVRLSLPMLPHGSTGPATRVRRTGLPWYTAIQDDHETLDCAESNTWEELAEAHRTLMPASKTPSGYSSSRYGTIPFPFAAGVHFRTARHGIPNCLVGRQRWDSPSICMELDDLFGKDPEVARAMVRDWREEAWYEYLRCFELTKRLEKKEYGKNSFFYRIEKGMLVDDQELGLLPDEPVHAPAESQPLSSMQQPTPEAEVGHPHGG